MPVLSEQFVAILWQCVAICCNFVAIVWQFVLEASYKLPPTPIYFWALGGWWVGGSVIIYFRGRGLSTQNAQLSAQNAEISAHNAEFKCAVLGGSGSFYLFMSMALWKLF